MQSDETNNVLSTKAGTFFWKITTYPKTILLVCFIAIVVAASFLPELTKDSSSESFIPNDHPAAIYREKVKDIFGLSDPVVVAVVNNEPTGIFNPHSLNLVGWLTNRISEMPGVDSARITSLTTENNIVGTEDGMLVEPFLELPITKQEEADKVRHAVMDFPLYVGSLVAPDGNATLIVAELFDESTGAKVYADILELVKNAPVIKENVYVAGEAAVVEYLGKYIDADVQLLNPIIGIIVAIILFFSYRTLLGVALPHLVLIGAVVVGLGSMAAAKVPFYIITGSLPVILIAISVADGIHILGEYYENVAKRPDANKQELVVTTMTKMWRPVTITSLSDIAGFMGISLASFMPPMKAYGIFASIGVAMALLISLFGIPAGLMLFKVKPSRAFNPVNNHRQLKGVDKFGIVMGKFGKFAANKSGYVLGITVCVVIAGIIGALKLEVNESRIENFKHSEAIYKADTVINNMFNGTNYLDIVVETDMTEGLFDPLRLKRIEALQEYMETLPHVKGTTSICDYLKQMNKAVNEDNPDAYRLPDNRDLIAQYFLLYSMNGNPTDFENEIDYDYRLANIRVTMDSGLYTDSKVVIESAKKYIKEQFNTTGITATLAGRLNVNYTWIKQLGQNHFRGVLIAFLAVWLTISISFRSVTAGLMAMLPVSLSVLLIYAVMGFCGIWLGVGTSMFAAIAIGLGVDFAVHVIDRLIVVVREEGNTLDNAFEILFPSTGRALLFSFLAVFFGFGVLTLSHALPLIRFGALVLVAVVVSFLASITVLPALVKVIQPGFLNNKNHR
ncbi:MAG: efflux RND transporter permease subunit [Candidatus Anammoxibacter sp.]